VRIVADANVLLSAVLGGRANLVLRHPLVEEILTTEMTLSEVEEYAAQLARKKRLALDVVLMAAAALPVTLVDQVAYSASLPDAKRRIGRRDPDDVEIFGAGIAYRPASVVERQRFRGRRCGTVHHRGIAKEARCWE